MKKLSYIKAISLIFVLFISAKAQNDVIINEIMYDPISGQPEWVEIYNRSSNNTYDLANWKLSDALNARTITTSSITIGPGEFVVLTQDQSITNFFNITATIIPMGSWSGLNNGGDEVVLIDNTSQTIDSLKYTSSWGVADKSIERIDVNVSSTDKDNWAATYSPNNGTPGYKNSVAPKDFDLATSEIVIAPTPIVQGFDFTASVKVVNLGEQLASSFSLKLYNDVNQDATIQERELINTVSFTNLESGDFVIQEYSLGSLLEGNYQLIGVVNFSEDEAAFNDTLIYNFTVLPPPPPFNSLVINEAMYAPPTGEPEWVEIYNRSNETYDLQYWKFADGVSTNPITYQSVTIAPKEYIVISDDASITNFYNINSQVIVMADFPGLNNSGDRLVLMEENSFVIDSLTYSKSWGGGDGKSLERINPNQPSYDPDNWGTSVSNNNATPGRINSIFPPLKDIAVSSITIDPSEPTENSEITARVALKNLGLNTASSFSVSLYNDINFDSTAEANELIDSETLFNLPSGNVIANNFNLGTFDAGDLRLIAEVNFSGDENTSNNQLIKDFVITPKPPAFNAIVINEIMYDPSSGEPEWIEIYNRSNTSYSILNWTLSDLSTTATITSVPITIAPDEYVIIAENENINNFYDINSRLITSNLPSLNNSNDKIILRDFNSDVVDSLTYFNSWGGGEGKSLERISVDDSSSDSQNWGTSTSEANATPGKLNSLTKKDFDIGFRSISFTPSPVIDGDNVTIKVTVENFGLQPTDNYIIEFYNDENKDSVAQADEKIGEQTQQLALNDTGSVTFQFANVTEGKYYFIFKADYANDEYKSNNTYYAILNVGEKPLEYNSLVINEIMYKQRDNEPEWIELYNRSNNSINIKNWHISDSKTTTIITNENVIIDPNSYLVITENDNISNYYDFPITFVSSNLPSLNDTGGDVIVISDSLIFANDSVKYSSSWGGDNGTSLERISPDQPSTNQENWGSSVSVNGATPGQKNSIVPRDYDLAVTYFDFNSTYLFNGEESKFTVKVKNLGTNPISDGTVEVYYDWNGDGFFTTGDIKEEFLNLELAPKEEVELEGSFFINVNGTAHFLAAAQLSNDTYSQNDSLHLTKEVIEPNVERGDIVINEFLYAPTSPYAEWIELYNTTDIPQQLRNFSIADSKDTVTISSQNILLPENSYIVIAKDSIITQLYNIPSNVIVKEFPSLNNSGDRIMLLDNFNRIIDSLEYSSDWGGKNGRSLERINPFGSSSIASNWVTSYDSALGTPGRINSQAPQDYDISIEEFYSTPSQPVSGQSVSFSANVVNKGTDTTSFSLLLYESNSNSAKNLLLETIQVNNLLPTEERTIDFNYKIESFSEDKFFIAEAQYEQDQDTTNNSKLLFVASPATPLSLVINEIMFNPDDEEPEWIELYNRSDKPINLNNWQVSDILANPVSEVITTQDVFVEPGEFIVLAKDSNIFEYHPRVKSNQVILVPFATLNNTNDGVVIYGRLGNVVDSVFYGSDFSKKSGYSIERLSTEENSNDPANWDYSLSTEKGTPGFMNSRVPKDFDLSVMNIYLEPEYPELNQTTYLLAFISNQGVQPSSDFQVHFISEDLGIDETINIGSIDPNIMVVPIAENSPFNMPESFEATVEIIYPDDQDISNNSFTKTFYSGYAGSSVLINEVMYDPTEGGTEWVEFVNATNYEINLNGWKAAEGSSFDSPKAFTEENVIIQPGEYFVIADDTSGGKFANVTSPVFESNFGELNSSGDIVAIFDFRGALIDSLKYSSSWGGGDGYSLERLSLQSATNLQTNWLASIVENGSTPGLSNSTAGITQSEAKQIVINEIMFEPETGNSEFVEFFNTTDQFVEIANWSVEDDSKNTSTITRNSFEISPNSYFVVAADSSILLNYPKLKEFDQLLIVNRNLSLNNSDDLILLSDAFGDMIDSVYYNSMWHNQKVITTKDKSLERINPFLDGNDNNNWSTSVAKEGATPGRANSVYIENQASENTISVSPNPFSPDGDGFEDFAIINYNLPRDVTSIQIKVFDSKGRKVRTINENNIFSKQGSIIFDGYNDDGQPLKIGIYILFIEALNSSSGTVDTFKEVVVVARKL